MFNIYKILCRYSWINKNMIKKSVWQLGSKLEFMSCKWKAAVCRWFYLNKKKLHQFSWNKEYRIRLTKARSTADQRQTVQHHTPTETEQNSGDLKSCLYQIAKCFSVPSDYLAKQLGGVITAVTYGVNALEKGNSKHFFVFLEQKSGLLLLILFICRETFHFSEGWGTP